MKGAFQKVAGWAVRLLREDRGGMERKNTPEQRREPFQTTLRKGFSAIPSPKPPLSDADSEAPNYSCWTGSQACPAPAIPPSDVL